MPTPKRSVKARMATHRSGGKPWVQFPLTSRGVTCIPSSRLRLESFLTPPMVSPPKSDVLRGSIELLVLKTLSLAPMHGWGIGQRIQQISDGELEVNQGSLYPALQRLEQRGLITSDWRTTEKHRRGQYYEITTSVQRALGEEMDSWRRFAGTIETILCTT
jgi:PadR family transcriptional regulator, regulatory protein PadR